MTQTRARVASSVLAAAAVFSTVALTAPASSALALTKGASPAYAIAPDPKPPPLDLYHYVECNPPLSIGNQYTYDDTDIAHINYNEFWKREGPMIRGLYRGTQHITNSGGSTASFTLPSAAYEFAFGFTKMRNAGLAGIYFNNQLITTLDMYAPANQYNCALILYWNPPPGTFMVKALNRKNPSSSGTYVNIDYIYYEP